jgi:hypothetical protein
MNREQATTNEPSAAQPKPNLPTEGNEAKEELVFQRNANSKIRSLPEFFTEGNEGNEGRSGPAKYNLCFLRYLLFKLLSPPPRNSLQKETKIAKIFKIRDYDLCSLGCLR